MDGTGNTKLMDDGIQPAFSPDGGKIAFIATNSTGGYSLYVANADGSGRVPLASDISIEYPPEWSPDGHRIGFVRLRSNRDLWSIAADGTDERQLTFTQNQERALTWSPDGSKIAVTVSDPTLSGSAGIWTLNAADGSGLTKLREDGGVPDWQPIPYTGYPRPKGASPLQVFLVPAYKPCVAANRTHGSPLSFGSCAPPQQTSDYLTVGTPDANGQPPKSVAEVIYKVKASAPADVLITVLITDVRNKSDLSDYTGEVRVNGVGAPFAELRITDRFNGESSTDPGTVVDIPAMPTPVACAPTADPTVGSSCNTLTSMNAIVPGSVVGGKRAIWQFDQITVVDGGADGNVATTDNTVFLKQGIFVP
jgi:dipeptidyl aminopeptidase/acylaminoacyl peptidase